MIASDDFVKSITSDDMCQLVTKCFDELMVLYHIVGSREDIEICADDKYANISFTLMLESETDAAKLTESMDGMDFSVYGMVYIVNMTCTGSSIKTIIRKASQ